jgi:hypothetical protein
VRGTHGRLPAEGEEGPVFISSDPTIQTDHVAATQVRDLLAELATRSY